MTYKDLMENVEKLGEGLVKPYVAFCVEAKHPRNEEGFETICILVYDAYLKDSCTRTPMDNYVQAIDGLLEENNMLLTDITVSDVLGYMSDHDL